LTEREVIDFCKHRLASYQKPKSVDFTDALPRNPTMKVVFSGYGGNQPPLAGHPFLTTQSRVVPLVLT
jgi:hypothetical protein